MFIDSHAHIDLALTNYSDINEINQLFIEQLSHIIHISLNPEKFLEVYPLLSQQPNISFATGYYPDHANIPNFDEEQAYFHLKELLFTYPNHCAIGEIGIDLKDESYGSLHRQKTLFERQLALSDELKLPIIIHSRVSFEETFHSLCKYSTPAVMHCFSYSIKEAEKVLARGDYISFAGILSYPKSVELQQVAKMIPLEQVLFETDSPYLSPVPYRGKANLPSRVRYIYQYFAELRNIPLEELCTIITQNFERAFHKKITDQ
ncbi:MAG: TatD family hydrolase [Brevinema sp.]